MKRIAILGIENGWHCRQMARAFDSLGVENSFFTADALVLGAGTPSPSAKLLSCDALLIRGIPGGSLEQVIYRMDALYTLSRAGVFCLNDPKSIEKTADKYFTSALLCEAGLPVPPTITAETAVSAMDAYRALGGDVVYKPLFGSCGNGLLRLTSEAAAREALFPLASAGSVLYLQRFIPCSNRDIRAFVVGGRVIAAMLRTGADWRANCSRGGTAKALILTPEQETFALAAANAVGAAVAGVDLLVSDEGETFVTEVNGCPGFHALSGVTDVDIAGEIAAYLLSQL